jgi:lipoprotein-anchoring transpeptidase ErfK/SrfK
MAMKKVFLFVILPLFLIAAATAAYILFKDVKPPSESMTMVSDTTFSPLPADKKLAQKELVKARKDLQALKPKIPYIVIDTHANKLSYRTEDSLFYRFTCSTGNGGILIDSLTGRKWQFNTPRGAFKILNKIKQPWWRKPDWAFIEEGEKPPKEESERLDPEMLGDFALGFGSGYFIHGTVYERLLGVSVTHGCVRLGSEDLKVIYDRVKPGTPVYIF